jgi:hypothetical protein
MFWIPQPDRHWGCRVNDRLTHQGGRALLLQNELIQVMILLDKGAEIVSFLHKPTDTDFLWRGPNPSHPLDHFSPTGNFPSSDFFDRWSGGWFEVLPNGGGLSSYRGAEFGQFAETINVPWEYRLLKDDPEEISVALWVKTYRTPFLLQKTLTLKSGIPALFLQERVTNEGCEPVDFMWGHHPVVGAPFLDDTCRLFAPPSRVEVFHAEDGPDHRMGLHQVGDWPVILDRDGGPLDLTRLPPHSARTMDNCYLKEFKEGWLAVVKPGAQLGFGLAWDASVFRYAWIWQALGGGIGYPWYGRTYAMGIEPWTSYPCAGLQAAVDRGTSMRLEPEGTCEARLTAVAITGTETVSSIQLDGGFQK